MYPGALREEIFPVRSSFHKNSYLVFVEGEQVKTTTVILGKEKGV